MYFIESSEEEAVGDTEGNKVPANPRRKLPPAEDGASSAVGAVSHSSKGEFLHFFGYFLD